MLHATTFLTRVAGAERRKDVVAAFHHWDTSSSIKVAQISQGYGEKFCLTEKLSCSSQNN